MRQRLWAGQGSPVQLNLSRLWVSAFGLGVRGLGFESRVRVEDVEFSCWVILGASRWGYLRGVKAIGVKGQAFAYEAWAHHSWLMHVL